MLQLSFMVVKSPKQRPLQSPLTASKSPSKMEFPRQIPGWWLRGFEKAHKNVMQAIQQVDCSEGFNRLNFQPTSYTDSQNREKPMYEMTRDGFTFLAMGFTGKTAAKFKEAYIGEFSRMENSGHLGANWPYRHNSRGRNPEAMAEYGLEKIGTVIEPISLIVLPVRQWVQLLSNRNFPSSL